MPGGVRSEWDIEYVFQPRSAAGKRIVERRLDAHVETDPQRRRSGSCEVVFNSRKEVAECPLAATKQDMHMLRLRCSRSVGRVAR